MDCSVISQDLCQKMDNIYQDFGKYLYRYAYSNVQILINKFQDALEVCFLVFQNIIKFIRCFFRRYSINDLQLLKNSLNMQVI